MWEPLLRNIITDGVGSTNWPLAVLCGNVVDITVNIDRTSVIAASHCLSPMITAELHVPESRHPSHSDIDIIVDCFSVNHELPDFFIFNVLIIILIYLL